MPESPPESYRESRRCHRRARSRLTVGILMLVAGAIILAANLGFMVPYQWWTYWPWLLIVLGVVPLVWPGSIRDRISGYWLLVVGAVGLIDLYGLLGLSWATLWPVFIIAAGLRVVIGGIFPRSEK